MSASATGRRHELPMTERTSPDAGSRSRSGALKKVRSLRVIEQGDRLGVGDLPALDHAQRLGERQFDHVDMLVLVDAAAVARAVLLAIGGDETGDLLRHAAWAHIGVEGVTRLRDLDAGLLERLADSADVGRVAIQHSGADLDGGERAVAEVRAGPELLDQGHDRPLSIVE